VAMSDDNDTKEPEIIGPYGTTTPWARRQAVLNARRDPAVKKRLIDTFGEAHIRRDFPEIFIEDDSAPETK